MTRSRATRRPHDARERVVTDGDDDERACARCGRRPAPALWLGRAWCGCSDAADAVERENAAHREGDRAAANGARVELAAAGNVERSGAKP